MFEIKRASRAAAKARIGLCGPSGSGKTLSSLLLAKGLCEALIESGGAELGPLEGKVAVLDTERGSSAFYGSRFGFDVLALEPPYTPERYALALGELEKHGARVIVIDSASHAWAGEGGVLEMVDTWKANAKHALSAWAKASPVQHRFIDRLLRSSAHLVLTLRTKTAWELEEAMINGQKKLVPRKLGLAPIQKSEFEFELSTLWTIDALEHTVTCEKDRTGLFSDRPPFRIDESTGRELARWLLSGEPAAAPQPSPAKAEEPKAAPATSSKARTSTRTSTKRTAAAKPPAARTSPPPPAEDPPENGFEEPDDAPIAAAGRRAVWDACKARASLLSLDPEVLLRTCLDGHGIERSDQISVRVLPTLMADIESYAPEEASA